MHFCCLWAEHKVNEQLEYVLMIKANRENFEKCLKKLGVDLGPNA